MGFFLISAPYLEKSKEATQREISQVVLRKNIVKGQQIFVERSRFKIANLDTLMFVNDKLLKLQSLIESFLKKLDKQYLDLNQNVSNQWLVKGLQKEHSIEIYLNQFKWNDSKYPRSHAIPRIAQSFQVKLNGFDGELRQKLNTFNEIRLQLSQITTKEGNYYTKDLTDLLVEPYISSNDFCYGKFITTVVAIVPAAFTKDFLANYEMFSNYVVPESAKQLKIPEKDGLTIWKINIFTQRIQELDREDYVDEQEEKKQNQQNKRKDRRHLTTVQQFIEKAREKMKIVVKEFKYTIGVSDERKKKRQLLDNKLKTYSRNLSDTCKTFFAEAYDMYMHAKMLRLVIETNMRFGTDPTLIYLLDTVQGKEKVVQSVLVEIFGDKENEGLYGTKDEIDDGQDFFPFVYVPLITF